jgi:competence protein ComEC
MLNWQQLPAVRLLIPLVAGISSCLLPLPIPHPSPVFALAVLFLLPLLMVFARRRGRSYRHRWVFGILLNLFLFVLGHWLAGRSDDRNFPEYIGRRHAGEAFLLAVAEECRPGSSGKARLTARVLMAGPSAADTFRLSRATGRLLLYLPPDTAAAWPGYGDTLVCLARLFPFRGPANPGGFDYRGYMHFQGVHLQGSVTSGRWAVVGQASGWSPTASAAFLQRYVTDCLSRYLGEGTENMAVGAALIIGNRDALGAELKAAYSETGAMHVLAVSGLHVGIVFLLLKKLVRLKRTGPAAVRMAKVGVVLAGIWAYAMVTGAAPSVVRSALMFSLATVGDALYRRHYFYNTLAAAAFLSLCLRPNWLATMSFQLSYLAVWGIVFFQPRLAASWRPQQRLIRLGWELTGVSVGAQLATLPLSLYHFGIFPVWFWLSSLVLVPLAGVELSLGFLLLLLDAWWPAAAAWTGWLLDGLVGTGNAVIHTIREFPFAVIRRIWISETDVWLLYLALAFLARTLVTRRIASFLPALLMLAGVCAGPAVRTLRQASARQLTIYSLPDGVVLDALAGSRLVTFQDQGGIPAADSPLQTFRRGLRITRQTSISLQDTTVFHDGHCYRDGPWLQFGSVRLFLADPRIPGQQFLPSPGTFFTHCLLTGGALPDMESFFSGFSGRLVIFGGDNDPRMVRRWKKSCEKHGVPWYDVREQGAFVLDAR